MHRALSATAIIILFGALPAARAADEPSRKLIVVLRLTAKDLLTAERSLFISQRIQSVLRASLREQYVVLSYADEQLQEIAKSNGVDLTQCSEDSCVTIGRKVSADFVVSGEVTQLDQEVDLTLRLQDVGSREVRRESVQKLARGAKFDDIAAAADLASAELAGELKTPGVVVKETTGLLALSVDPADATVAIDGKPAEALAAGRLERFLPLGQHSLVVGKQGYQYQSTPAFIEAGKPQTIALTLMRLPSKIETPKTATLGVDSYPQDARIFIDGVDMNKRTPAFLHELGTGEHEVVVQKDLFLPYRRQVILNAGDNTSSVMAKLHTNAGSLVVRTQPAGATVFIDDEERPERTPFRIDHLIARAYRLRFSLPRYQPMDAYAVVKPDEEAISEVTLTSRFGSVVINSEPAGANVYLDGDQRPGQTPLTLDGIEMGSHSIRLTKPLYADAQKSVTVEPGKKREVALSLSAKFGTLRVTAESGGAPLNGAEVFIDGQKVGITPYENQSAKEGSATIEVRAEMYRSFETVVRVQPSAPAAVDAKLAQEFGTLTASATPAAHLLVDGADVGNADGSARRLRMGRHEITLEPLDPAHYHPYVGALIIEPAQEVTLSQTLGARKGGALVLSLPTGAMVFRGQERLGTTPLNVSEWLVGEYTLRLEKEMYVPSQVQVKIDEGGMHPVEVTMLSVDLVKYADEQRTAAFTRAGLWTGATAAVAVGAGILYGLARSSASDAQTALQQYNSAASPTAIAQQRAAIDSANSTAIRERNVSLGLTALAAVGVAWVVYEFMSVPPPAQDRRSDQ